MSRNVILVYVALVTSYCLPEVSAQTVHPIMQKGFLSPLNSMSRDGAHLRKDSQNYFPFSERFGARFEFALDSFNRVNLSILPGSISEIDYSKTWKSLILIPEVLRQVEATDKQSREVIDFLPAFRKFAEKFKQDTKINDPDRPEFQKMVASFEKDYLDYLEQTLLPHQKQFLKQVAIQFDWDQFGVLANLIQGRVGKDLEVTNGQKKALLKKAPEIKKMVEEELAKLKAKVERELLAELTAEQRAQLKKMKGDPIAELNIPDFNRIKVQLDYRPSAKRLK
jgi:hypothetical protein